MALTLAEVEHIAELARLELSAEEKERYRVQLSAILEYAHRLQELDTSDIAPTASILPQRNPLREDIEAKGLPLDKVLQNAPHQKNKQFKVPPVFGEQDG